VETGLPPSQIAHDAASAERRNRLLIALAVFAAGFLLRFLPLSLTFAIAHADEVYQGLEPGHRLVFGYGFVPWEFDYHARSWALGVMAAGGMEIAKWLGGGPSLYLPLVHATFAALGAATTLCVFLWGRRIYDPAGAAAAALVSASWIDNVYFGGRSLTEMVAVHLLILGVYFGLHEPSSRGRWLLGGALAGAAIALRMQLAPAVALLWIWPGASRPRLLYLSLGALLGFAADGVLDLATGSFPFEPLWQNFRFNMLLGGSAAAFGATPWYDYIILMVSNWGASAALFVPLALLGARRQPILLAMAAIILLVHMAVGHKEYRFILPAITLLSILAGFGLVELTRLMASGLGAKTQDPAPLWLAACVGLCWTAIAGLGAIGRDYHDFWRTSNAVIEAELYAGKLPALCGLGHNRKDAYIAGGYSFLHRRVPIFAINDGDPGGARKYAAVNVLIEDTTRPFAQMPEAFRRLKCFGTVCLFVRPGACALLLQSPVPLLPLSPEVAHLSGYPRIAGVE